MQNAPLVETVRAFAARTAIAAFDADVEFIRASRTIARARTGNRPTSPAGDHHDFVARMASVITAYPE
jgi:hypothetical protein